jgi:hypothetical protein
VPVFGQAPALSGVVSEEVSAVRLSKEHPFTNQVFMVKVANVSCRSTIDVFAINLKTLLRPLLSSSPAGGDFDYKKMEKPLVSFYSYKVTICCSLCFGKARGHLSLRYCTNLSRT